MLHFRYGLLYCYDATARTDVPLTQLTHQVMSSHCSIYFLDVSPNGKQVIWGVSGNNPLFVSTINGVRREQWPSDNGMSEPHWSADGRHWMQFHFGGDPQHLRWMQVQVHSLDSPRLSETFSSPPPGLNGLDILAAPSADEIIARTPDPVTYETPRPDKVVEHADGTSSYSFTEAIILRGRQTLSVWSLRHPQPLHRYAIALPGRAQEVAVSPDGRRVAWLLTTGGTSSQSLWTSELDGSRMHKIDVVHSSSRRVHGPLTSFVSQLCWVPGNKQLSFLYGDALWTVPAE